MYVPQYLVFVNLIDIMPSNIFVNGRSVYYYLACRNKLGCAPYLFLNWQEGAIYLLAVE